MLKIRRSRYRPIFIMGIPKPGKDGLYIEMGPWSPTITGHAGEVSELGSTHQDKLKWINSISAWTAMKPITATHRDPINPEQYTVQFDHSIS